MSVRDGALVFLAGLLAVALLSFTAGGLLWWWLESTTVFPGLPIAECPGSSHLYTRTELHGRLLAPIQHCFSDANAEEPKEPAPGAP